MYNDSKIQNNQQIILKYKIKKNEKKLEMLWMNETCFFFY